MSTVSELPPAPKRSDGAEFSTIADTFLGALPQFQSEINVVAGEVNANTVAAATSASTAASAAASAVGTTNYKGDYASGTTYAQGDSVSYGGDIYLSKVGSNLGNQPDISSTEWLAVVINPPFLQPPQVTTTDLSLSSSSVGFHKVSSAATAPVYYTLPDATTMTARAAAYTFINDSDFTVMIYDSTGKVVTGLSSKQSKVINLDDTSTAAGSWTVGNKGDIASNVKESWIVNKQSLPNDSLGGYFKFAQISDTRYIVAYRTSAEVKVVIFDIDSKGVPTYYTDQVVVSTASNEIAITLMSPTMAIVGYRDTDTYPYAVAISISGTDLTVNAASSPTNTNATSIDVESLSETTFAIIFGYQSNSSYYLGSVSGTTISYGSNGSVAAITNAPYQVSAKKLDSQTVIFGQWYSATANDGNFKICTFNGTTITTTGSAFVSDYANGSILPLGNSRFALGVQQYNSITHVLLYSYSGVTPTLQTTFYVDKYCQETQATVQGSLSIVGLTGDRIGVFHRIQSAYHLDSFYYSEIQWDGLNTLEGIGYAAKPVICSSGHYITNTYNPDNIDYLSTSDDKVIHLSSEYIYNNGENAAYSRIHLIEVEQ